MNKKSINWIVVSLVLLSGIMIYISFESDYVHAGAVIHVGLGPGNDSATISDGILLANDGDTIYVHGGIYSESIIVNKTVTLTGESKENTLINGTASTHVIMVRADWINITGFEITGGGESSAGIYVKGYKGCSISDNIIRDTGYGIFILSSANNTISENNISNSGNEGIYVENSPHNGISFNGILNSSHNGIGLHQVSNNTVSLNNISGCEKDGINFYNLSDSTISENHISDNSWNGIFGSLSTKNTISENNINNNSKWAASLSLGNNNTITDNIIHNNSEGIGLRDISENNKILTNNVSGGTLGIYSESKNDIISDNTCINGWLGIRTSDAENITITGNTVSGIEISSSSNITVLRNIIPGISKRVYVYFSDFNTFKNNQVELIHLVGSENNTFLENTVGRFNIDRGSDFNIFSRHNISNSLFGFEIDRSSNNLIQNNNVSNCTYALHLILNAQNNTFISNKLSSNNYGVFISDSSHNNINDNIVVNNEYGFYLEKSQDNVITNNSVMSNSEYGFYLLSEGNSIFHNFIVDNENQSHDDTVNGNQWDNGYPSGGNYWSDYLGYDNFSGELQDILGGDGLGDIPYIIDNNSHDNYPVYKSSGPILPQAPQNLQVASGFSEITLTWQEPFSDGGDPVTNYKVYRGLSEDDMEVLADLGYVLSYTDSDVEKDVNYFYKVSAVNGISEGPLTNYVNATLQIKPTSGGNDTGGMILIIIVVIIVAVVLLLLVLLMRKRMEDEEDVEQEQFESNEEKSKTLDEQFPPQDEHLSDSEDGEDLS
jgi:parallel beta-helix repeat protein